MRAAIIGAGVAGCAMARMLAEQGYSVDVYEAQEVGGIAAAISLTLRLHYGGYMFLSRRTRVMGERELPGLWIGHHACSTKVMCQELLDYRGVQVLQHAPITQIWELNQGYEVVILAARPDVPMGSFLGELPYDSQGFPMLHAASVQLYGLYRYVYKSIGVVGVGSAACYSMLTVDEILAQAHVTALWCLERKRDDDGDTHILPFTSAYRAGIT